MVFQKMCLIILRLSEKLYIFGQEGTLILGKIWSPNQINDLLINFFAPNYFIKAKICFKLLDKPNNSMTLKIKNIINTVGMARSEPWTSGVRSKHVTYSII